jgi:hydrogenase maturation protein HypF
LAELFDPADRRYRYPFLNCTNCGPRLTIISGAPYDRAMTTMSPFTMCADCRAEYEDPTNRRFHAQPNACPACGPRLLLQDNRGGLVATNDPLRSFATALGEGRIGALKGLGGYHLVCDARDSAAVGELRRRKHRDERPFAVMVTDVNAAEAICGVSAAERLLLCSPGRPIVLLRRRHCGEIADDVAPGNPFLGVMLPYTPLHHLLMRTVGGAPLVMTSGNRSEEPIAYEDSQASTRLAGIADLFLGHDRRIHLRCDDSVTRIIDDIELPLRRSRGYAPQPIDLPFSCPRPALAFGGQLKVTFALGRERQAFLSHHMGDLDQYDAFRAFEKDVALYQQLFAVRPECLVHDLHPDYVTTRLARDRAAREGAEVLAVQHHHAHMASCMAEHGLTEPVIGVTFDGTGYGTDGAVWGGEFLIGDYRNFRRRAHLRYVGMPGGEQAIREPWRMACAHLMDAQIEFPPLRARLLPVEARTVAIMLSRQFNTPQTSSAGRLFDAVAALAGVRDRVTYEGQAAIELEWLASETALNGTYPFVLNPPRDADSPWIVDTRPSIRAIVSDVTNEVGAAVVAQRFHSTLVEMIAEVCDRLRDESRVATVVLSGGVFLNALLTHEVTARLATDGFRTYRHHLVPPNDGGLSLGQLAVFAAHER